MPLKDSITALSPSQSVHWPINSAVSLMLRCNPFIHLGSFKYAPLNNFFFNGINRPCVSDTNLLASFIPIPALCKDADIVEYVRGRKVISPLINDGTRSVNTNIFDLNKTMVYKYFQHPLSEVSSSSLLHSSL